ncbi:hypothetical protein TSAR_008749, partial [Trichomalopsis sarcophagae]
FIALLFRLALPYNAVAVVPLTHKTVGLRQTVADGRPQAQLSLLEAPDGRPWVLPSSPPGLLNLVAAGFLGSSTHILLAALVLPLMVLD